MFPYLHRQTKSNIVLLGGTREFQRVRDGELPCDQLGEYQWWGEKDYVGPNSTCLSELGIFWGNPQPQTSLQNLCHTHSNLFISIHLHLKFS